MCKNKVVNAGKTTLITRLLPVLTDYGLKVATVKHDGHEFEGLVSKNETVDMHFHMCYAYEDFERQRKSLFKAIILDHSIWG